MRALGDHIERYYESRVRDQQARGTTMMTVERLIDMFRARLAEATATTPHDRVVIAAVRTFGRGGRAHHKLTLQWLAHVGALRVAPASIEVERQMVGADAYRTDAENPVYRDAHDRLLAVMQDAARPPTQPKKTPRPSCPGCGAEPGWGHASFCTATQGA